MISSIIINLIVAVISRNAGILYKYDTGNRYVSGKQNKIHEKQMSKTLLNIIAID